MTVELTDSERALLALIRCGDTPRAIIEKHPDLKTMVAFGLVELRRNPRLVALPEEVMHYVLTKAGAALNLRDSAQLLKAQDPECYEAVKDALKAGAEQAPEIAKEVAQQLPKLLGNPLQFNQARAAILRLHQLAVEIYSNAQKATWQEVEEWGKGQFDVLDAYFDLDPAISCLDRHHSQRSEALLETLWEIDL